VAPAIGVLGQRLRMTGYRNSTAVITPTDSTAYRVPRLFGERPGDDREVPVRRRREERPRPPPTELDERPRILVRRRVVVRRPDEPPGGRREDPALDLSGQSC